MLAQLFQRSKSFCCKYPAVFLIVFVYTQYFAHLNSWERSWMQPEEFMIKSYALEHGSMLTLEDFKRGLNSERFEYASRPTRPLSSYFEIIDAKFRSWLWQYIPPHPSASLTWIFSLIITPFVLFLFLRRLNIEINLALVAVSYYLSTPAVMSGVFMLFRPTKVMTNCAIVLCLYWASCIHNKYLKTSRQQDVPILEYCAFLATVFLGFFWDETALIMYPMLFLFFPSILLNKKRSILFLLLPFLTAVAYFVFIPSIAITAGWSMPQLANYFHEYKFGDKASLNFGKNIFINSWILLQENLGLIIPTATTSKNLGVLIYLNWVWVLFLIGLILSKSKMALLKVDRVLWWLLAGLILFGAHNYFLSITNVIWGPYYYGAFTSIFFAITLAKLIERSGLKRSYWMVGILVMIAVLWMNFFAVNRVYKAFHYYPHNPLEIRRIYTGEVDRFDPLAVYAYRDQELKTAAYEYWSRWHAQSKELTDWKLPKELLWLPIEMNPGVYRFSGEFFIHRKYYSREEFLNACRNGWVSKNEKVHSDGQ